MSDDINRPERGPSPNALEPWGAHEAMGCGFVEDAFGEPLDFDDVDNCKTTAWRVSSWDALNAYADQLEADLKRERLRTDQLIGDNNALRARNDLLELRLDAANGIVTRRDGDER